MKKFKLSLDQILWLIGGYAFLFGWSHAMLRNSLSPIQIFGLSTIVYIIIVVFSYISVSRSMKKDQNNHEKEDKDNE